MLNEQANSPGSEPSRAPGIGRRDLLQGAAALLGTALVSPRGSAAQGGFAQQKTKDNAPASGPAVIASDETAIAETVTGRIRGYLREGIFTFKGIPYADTTAGSGRFAPPRAPQPWAGVRSSMHYGPVCPQAPRGTWGEDEESFLFDYEDGYSGEDCLRLNIWTPSIQGAGKRPVMVWLHGGGFVSGSCQEHRFYDGERLSRRGDVVVVSLNHRLGPLGFLNLIQFGKPYAASANLGMLDIVAALEWVRGNIGNFGGDASKVTIFGQSGGGGKVGALMAMPAAQGLFHRAIVQSGSFLRALVPERSEILTRAVFDELNLSPSQVDKLQSIPLQTLIAAGDAALLKTHPPTPLAWNRVADILGWGPVVDGEFLPHHPFDPAAPAISAQVPMLIGTTLNEFTTTLNHPELEAMTRSVRTGSWKTNIFCRNTGECSPDDKTKWPVSRAPASRNSSSACSAVRVGLVMSPLSRPPIAAPRQRGIWAARNHEALPRCRQLRPNLMKPRRSARRSTLSRRTERRCACC